MVTIARRPTKLFRSPLDQADHARKGQPLGLSAEEHAMLSFLVTKREIDLMSLRGLRGPDLATRVRTAWAPPSIPNGPNPVSHEPVQPGDTVTEFNN